ncbi:MAG: YitT family protein [Actinomycetia bacterium]|nr:YitT family protein [Actinomycetes bacterium]
MNDPRVETVRDYILIAVGTALTALGVNVFYAPNRISDGGVAGLGIILLYLWHVPVWVTLTALNVPLIWLSHRLWGARVGGRTVFGTLMLSLWVAVLHPTPPTHDLLLATVYGGLLSGVGLGLVFRSKGTTGGTDILARLIARWLPVSVGQGLLAVDFFVIGGFGVLFNATQAMYSLIALFISTRAIDVVQEGVGFARQAIIVSDHNEAIGRRVLEELGRGATAIPARGLYTRRERPALLVVVSRSELTRLKDLVYHIDPGAFVIISAVHEVVGEGFRPPSRSE